MSRKAIIISLLAMFLSGAALGLMGGIMFSHHMHQRMMGGPDGPGFFGGPGGPGPGMGGGPRGPHGGGPGRDPIEDVLPRLTHMLELQPDQVQRIEIKVRGTRGEFAAVRESLHSRIESELTPEQIQRWREMRERMADPGNPRGSWRRIHRANPGNQGAPK